MDSSLSGWENRRRIGYHFMAGHLEAVVKPFAPKFRKGPPMIAQISDRVDNALDRAWTV
jgi:hypothetical protein